MGRPSLLIVLFTLIAVPLNGLCAVTCSGKDAVSFVFEDLSESEKEKSSDSEVEVDGDELVAGYVGQRSQFIDEAIGEICENPFAVLAAETEELHAPRPPPEQVA